MEDERRKLIGDKLGKPFVPEGVHVVHDLPKTRNARIMRRLIRSAYLGESTGDLNALFNPEAMDETRTPWVETDELNYSPSEVHDESS